MGRSKAQDELQELIAEIFPAAYVTDEVYIGDLIEERGYTIKEITRELGHKPHKMFVDIVLRDSDATVAFEYHGEQHYSLVGNMTKTSADLIMNQQLDQEKSWILNRIGIPLVAVPFDMYIDESVLDNLISQATQECMDGLQGYILCESCNKLFPQESFTVDGICKSCSEKATEIERQQEKAKRKSEAAQRRKQQAEQRRASRKAYRESNRTVRKRYTSCAVEENDDDDIEMSYDEKMKAEAKRRRKEQAEAWKNSPEYAAQKEEAKRRRREQAEAWKNSPEYAAQKEEAKRRRREAYQRAKAERKKR